MNEENGNDYGNRLLFRPPWQHKKLLDAIATVDHEVSLINVTEKPDTDLSTFDRIGFASGIYFSSFAKQIISDMIE